MKNADRIGYGLLGLGAIVILAILAYIFIFGSFRVPNSGQHTGYVTSVEQSGIIWKTWTAYIKTDPQSSQEDAYCVIDPAVVTDLQNASAQQSLVTVYYSAPLVLWKWQCGYEPSVIQSVFTNSGQTLQPTGTTGSSLDTSASAADPASYQVNITQTGGLNSQAITTTAIDLSTETNIPTADCGDYISSSGNCYNWLIPAQNYASISFDSPGEVTERFQDEPTWVGLNYELEAGCINGYAVTDAQSPTGNPLDTLFVGIPGYTVGMEILDQPINTIEITCKRQ